MVLPERLMEAYEKNCSFFSLHRFQNRSDHSERIILSGAFERHLNRMRKAYRERSMICFWTVCSLF